MIIYFNPYLNYYVVTVEGGGGEPPVVYTGTYLTQVLRQAYYDAVGLGSGNYVALTGLNSSQILVAPDYNLNVLPSGLGAHTGNGIIGPGASHYKILMSARPESATGAPLDPGSNVTGGRGSFFSFTNLKNLRFEGFHLGGQAPTTTGWGNPYDYGSGWDTTNKGFRGDLSSSGFDNIYFKDIWISGFRGEMIYAGGDSNNGLIILEDCKLWDCNASAISCTASIFARNIEGWDNYNFVENFAFENQHQIFINCSAERRSTSAGGYGYAYLGLRNASLGVTGGNTKNTTAFLLADFAHNVRASGIQIENGRLFITAGNQGSAYDAKRATDWGFSGLNFERISLYASSGAYRAVVPQQGGSRRPVNLRIDGLSIYDDYPNGYYDYLIDTSAGFSGNCSVNNTVVPSRTKPWENENNSTPRLRMNNCPIRNPLTLGTSAGTPTNYDIAPVVEGVYSINTLGAVGHTGHFQDPNNYNDENILPSGFTISLRNDTANQTYFQPITGGTNYSIAGGAILDLVYTGSPQGWGLPTYFVSTGIDENAVTIGSWDVKNLNTKFRGTHAIIPAASTQEDLKQALSYYHIPQKGWYEIKFHTPTGIEDSYGVDIMDMVISGAGGRITYDFDCGDLRGGWINLGQHHLDVGYYGVVGVETLNNASGYFDDTSVEYKTLHHVQNDLTRSIINSGDGWDVYRNRLASGNNPTLNTEGFYSRRIAYNTNRRAQNYWDTLIKDGNLYDPDIGTGRMNVYGGVYYNWSANSFASPTMYSLSMRRFMHMAHCYLFQNNCNHGLTGIYQNKEVISGINSGLKWIATDRFNTAIDWTKWSGDPTGAISPTNTWSNDWFGLEISFPQTFGEIMCLIGDQIDPATLNTFENFMYEDVRKDNTSWLQYNTTPPTLGIDESANLLFVQKAWMYMGIYRNSGSYLTDVKNIIDVIFDPVSTGEHGWYEDGGYKKDGNLEIAGYLNNMVRDVPEIIGTLSGTAYEISHNTIDRLEQIYNYSFEPFFTHNNHFWVALAGRGIATQSAENDKVGWGQARSWAHLANLCLTGELASGIKKAIKTVGKANDYWATSIDETSIQDWKSSLHAANILDNPTVQPYNLWPNRARVLNSVCTAVYRRPTWSALIRAGNMTTKPFENYNNDNRLPWYQGEVTTYLENNDGRWLGDAIPTLDPYRWPGTTIQIDQPRVYNQSSQLSTVYPNINWAGGTALNDEILVFGSDYNNSNYQTGDLVAKKSVFMVADYKVYLGAGISANSGYRIAHNIEQIKINAAGDNRLSINGVDQSTSYDWTGVFNNCNRIFIEGNNGVNEGIYFFDAAGVTGYRTERTGSWGVLDNEESASIKNNRFIALEIDYGINPSTGAYSYVILPNTTESIFNEFVANPNIIVSNTTGLQYIEYGDFLAANIWSASTGAPATIGNWSFTYPCSFIVKNNTTGLEFSVCAPNAGNNWVRISNSEHIIAGIYGQTGVSGVSIYDAGQGSVDVELGNKRKIINFGWNIQTIADYAIMSQNTLTLGGEPLASSTNDGSPAAGTLSLTYLSDHRSSSIATGANTFSAVSLGAASSDRYVVVVVQWRHQTAGVDISGVTIGGQAATQAVEAVSTDSTHMFHTEIWYALVTSGTTGDIVVTVTGSPSGTRSLAVDTYSMTGASSIAVTDTATGNNSASYSETLTCSEGGAVLGSVISNPTAGTVVTWTGDVTEDYEEDPGATDVGSAASASALSAGTVDANASVAGGFTIYTCYAACTFESA